MPDTPPDNDDAAGEPTDGAAGEPPTAFGVPVTHSRGQEVLHPHRDQLADLAMELRDEHGFNVCVDVTAVDYLAYEVSRDLPEGVEGQRYEVVVGLLSHRDRRRLRLRVQVPDDDPVVPSLFQVHPGSEGLEREVFDMFGIRFEGHPDMTRILMPEDWEGYPLRKQYPVGTIPVQFKGISNDR